MNDTTKRPHSKNLRTGRISLPNHAYLITIATASRTPVFTSFAPARIAARCFYDAAIARHSQTLAFVVMPDHVHWLCQLNETGSLTESIRLYKAKVSWSLGARIWQRGFHDHALRHEDDLRDTARYIVANPLRAGLVKEPGQYPYWNAAWL
jgi:REP element-mobilizing transposase RayT